MLPVLFTIGPYQVYAFGFFLSLSFVLSTFIVWKHARAELKEEEYLNTFFYTSFIALISARVVYILFHLPSFGFNILKYIVVVETPGLSLLGGLLGGLFFLYWYSRQKKYDFFSLSDLFALAYSFSLVLVKIGEQLGGVSFGRETNFILGVEIIGKVGRFHPVELYEAILFFILFCLLEGVFGKMKKKKYFPGLVSYSFVAFLAVIIFTLEFLKANSVYLYVLSIKQIIALIILIVIAFPLWKRLQVIRRERL